MAPTAAQDAWVGRVLFGGAQDWDQDSPDLVLLKIEARAVRSSTRASNEDFEKVRKLFVRLSAMVEAAGDAGLLTQLSESDTEGGGDPAGQVPRATNADLANLSGLFDKVFAGAAAAAPSASLLKLAQLGAGPSEGPSVQPSATQAQLDDIEQGLKEARMGSTIELNDLLALANL